MSNLYIFLLFLLGSLSVYATNQFDSVSYTVASSSVKSVPLVGKDVGRKELGRKAAAQHLKNSSETEEDTSTSRESSRGSSDSYGGSSHHLDIGGGKYMSSQAWEWGQHGKIQEIGDVNIDVTYRVGEWKGSMDMNIRVDYQEFKFTEKRVNKLSFLPLITFPDANSKFPLYFGAGVGLGVFMNQLPDESPLSLDYQLVLGARFFDVYENSGFFVESGLKDHLHLLTNGQLNGTFLTGGMVFTF